MGALTYEQLNARLAQAKLGGSYFLEGEDTFLRDETITRLAPAAWRRAWTRRRWLRRSESS